MTPMTPTFAARYFTFMKDILLDMPDNEQIEFWQYVGIRDERFTQSESVRPTYFDKLAAFEGENEIFSDCGTRNSLKTNLCDISY